MRNLVWQNKAGVYNEAICSRCSTHRIRLNLELNGPKIESAFVVKLIGANPSKSTTTTFAIYAPEASNTTIAVFNINGQQVRHSEWQTSQGWGTYDLIGLPETPGMYTVQITSRFGSETIRLIKH